MAETADPSRLKSGWGLAIGSVGAVCTIVSTLFLILNGVPDLWHKTVLPTYSIQLDPRGDLIQGGEVSVRLLRKDPVSHSLITLEGYQCRLEATLPTGDPWRYIGSGDAPCTFIVGNPPGLLAGGTVWPLHLKLVIQGQDEHGRAITPPVGEVLLHDLQPAVVVLPSGRSVSTGAALPVSIRLNSAREKAEIKSCRWEPRLSVIVGPNLCEAIFIFAPTDTTQIVTISAKVTVLAGGREVEVPSDGAIVTVLAKPPADDRVDGSLRPATPATATQPDNRPLGIATDREMPSQPSPRAASASQTAPTASTLNDLISLLNGEDAIRRYKELEVGVSRLPLNMPISVAEALALLGPTDEPFRNRALTTWLLPHVARPLNAEDTVSLLTKLNRYDRTTLLGDLTGCIQRPIGPDERRRLLTDVDPMAWHDLDARLQAPAGACPETVAHR